MLGKGAGVLNSVQFENKKETTEFFTLGKVEDTNDPEQMGRVRVRCAGYGDGMHEKLSSLPWALPISPLAGVMTHGVRGVEQAPIDAPVAYGMWNVPKMGSFVLVGCLDGDKSKRFYIGGIHSQYISNTVPHGRYIWSKESEDKTRPEGPLSANEIPIEPLYSNITDQFTQPAPGNARLAPGTPSKPREENAEYMSRGADMQAGAIDEVQTQDEKNSPGNIVADHIPGNVIEQPLPDGTTRKILGPGYSKSQIDPDMKRELTGDVNYDSHNYSWTTPGFHSIAMNDRYDQCRIRVRTTSGHQIIMDDTNERIYISSAGGQSYIEIDSVGNIDIYASKNISTHAQGDINFFADKTIRMQAIEGIHMRTDGEFRIHSLEDFHVRSELNIRTYSQEETRIEVNMDMHTQVRGTTYISSTGPLHAQTSGTMHLSSTARLNMTSAEMIAGEAPQIHWNSAKATAATQAQDALEIQSNWTTRVPEHEPWARIFMKESDSDATATDKTNLHTPEYPYTDALVGKGGRGETYIRNKWWQR